MSVPWNLHRLYSLDPSSPDFLRRLHSLIRHDEEEQYLSNLQGWQLTRLVDFLDRVRIVPLVFHQFMIHSTDPWRHPHNRQYCTRVSTQATSHLRPPRDPTILIHHIW